MTYKQYLRISANLIVAKRERCDHNKHLFDEVVYYKRCKECGTFVAFRNPADIERRGEIGRSFMFEEHSHEKPVVAVILS